jgi:hypothetical protein
MLPFGNVKRVDLLETPWAKVFMKVSTIRDMAGKKKKNFIN